MKSITIIGSGLAGYNLAKEVRKLDQDIPLNIITSDGGESYSKPMLSNALSKGKTVQQLVIKSAEEMAEQLKAKIINRTFVTNIDPEKRVLQTESENIPFDQLVLATGASQVQVPLDGNASDKVLTINNLDDYERFQSKLENANKVAIIGAGLIGCEFANDLVSVNKNVTVIGSSETPLDRLLLPEIGQQLKNALQQKGVTWQLGVTAKSIDQLSDADSYRISLSDGTLIDAELVISAIGLLPNIDLAQQAGIITNKGILVDEYLQTSLTGVYALGDCIEINSLVLAYVLPIMQCARALAKTLTGNRTSVNYPAMPVVVKTPDYPMVISPPASNATGHWQLEMDSSGAKALFIGTDQQLKGFVLTDQKISEKQALTKQLPGLFN